ncbi:hypothetical protein MRX96_036434 [Rhipicephalus microplus]
MIRGSSLPNKQHDATRRAGQPGGANSLETAGRKVPTTFPTTRRNLLSAGDVERTNTKRRRRRAACLSRPDKAPDQVFGVSLRCGDRDMGDNEASCARLRRRSLRLEKKKKSTEPRTKRKEPAGRDA